MPVQLESNFWNLGFADSQQSASGKQEIKLCTEIGFVPVVRKDPSRGKKIFEETGHLDTFDLDRLDGEGDTSSESDSEDEERQATDDAEREANEDNDEREAVKAKKIVILLN